MVEGSGDGGSAGPDIDLVTLQPGQSIGRYRIVAVLGQGGFGITYRAVDSELGRDVAIKEFLPAALAVRKDGVTVVPRSRSAAEDLAWGLDRFVDEGRTLAALHRAPGIVKVHDYLRANGTAYLVMELVDGETLLDRIVRNGPLDAAAIDRILAPLLDGLAQVHAAGFLHRDIKPANILIDSEGRPTLIDFGASRAAIAGRSQALTAVFTPGYAPVEQFTSATQGPWTDIYGLGASLYHAITGSPPPTAIDRLLQDTCVPLSHSGRAYPAALLAGIDAALAVRAAERPQSVAAWRAVLGSAAAPPPATVKMAAMASPARPPVAARPDAAAQPPAPGALVRKPGAALRIAAGVGLMLAFAGGGWLALGPGSAVSPPAPAPSGPLASAPPPTAVAAAPVPPAQDRAQQELEQARREQRAAQEEAARLRAEAEARRKADEEAALRARIEQEFREKAAAEEARRQAEAQAAADATARAKADAEAKAAADEGRRQQAEAQAAAAAARAKAEEEAKAAAEETRRQAEARAAAAAAKAKAEAEQKRQLAQPPAPGQAAAPSAGGARPCEGTFRSQWCRSAYQGFPPNCWHATMTIRNGEVSDSWISQADRSQRNLVSGYIDANGNVSLTYNGIGQQTHIAQRFTATMSGRIANGVLTATGRASGGTGREFTVTVACR